MGNVIVTLLALLLAGCATLPPHATDASMAERARCLDGGMVWMETQQEYVCRHIPRGYQSPMPGGGVIVPNTEPI